MVPSLTDAVHDAKNLQQTLLFWREQLQVALVQTRDLRVEMARRTELVVAEEQRWMAIVAALTATLYARSLRDGVIGAELGESRLLLSGTFDP